MEMFTDNLGKVSWFRVVATGASVLGAVVTLVGAYRFLFGDFNAPQVIGMGSALITAVLATKAWQKSSEARLTEE